MATSAARKLSVGRLKQSLYYRWTSIKKIRPSFRENVSTLATVCYSLPNSIKLNCVSINAVHIIHFQMVSTQTMWYDLSNADIVKPDMVTCM